MGIYVVQASLKFQTPSGPLEKHVNWSRYETVTTLSPSTTANEAFDTFLQFGKRIINASPIHLQYLCSICFYEVNGVKNSMITSEVYNETPIITIERDHNGNMTFKVQQE